MFTVPRSGDSRSEVNDSSSAVDRLDQRGGQFQQPLPIVRQRDARPAALEQLHAEFSFQGFDLQRDGRLAQEHLVGRFGDAVGTGGVAKAAELLQAIVLIAGGGCGHDVDSRAAVKGSPPAPEAYTDDSAVSMIIIDIY